MKSLYKKITFGLAIVTTIIPAIVSAQSDFEVKNPLGVTTITALLDAIGGYFYGLAAAVATIMILYGAFLILTAGSDSTKVQDGKNAIFYAAMGLAIVVLASGLKSLVVGILGGGKVNQPDIQDNFYPKGTTNF